MYTAVFLSAENPALDAGMCFYAANFFTGHRMTLAVQSCVDAFRKQRLKQFGSDILLLKY